MDNILKSPLLVEHLAVPLREYRVHTGDRWAGTRVFLLSQVTRVYESQDF